jgi:hypothetical protein
MASRTFVAAGCVVAVLLSACEPAEVIELRRPDDSPVLCPEGERTSFTVSFLTRGSGEVARHLTFVDATQDAFSTRPAFPLAGILAGSVENGRLEWIQFDIFCGKARRPFVSTPRIEAEDLIRRGERLFVFIVSDAPAADSATAS